MQNADGKRNHSPYALTWILPVLPAERDPTPCSGQNCLWNWAKAQSPAYWWTDNSRGSNKWFCVLLPGKRKLRIFWNSDGPLWELTSKMVLKWVIPTLEWQIMKYKGKWYSGIQYTARNGLVTTYLCEARALPWYLNRNKIWLSASFLKVTPALQTWLSLVLNLLLDDYVGKDHHIGF